MNQTRSLDKKLFELQKALAPIKKDSKNPHFGNKYFDINSLLAEIKPRLTELKILLTQSLKTEDGKTKLETCLTDLENEAQKWTSSIYLPEIVDPQKIGSAISYFRRYSLVSLLALEAEDDDGNLASGRTNEEYRKPVAPVAQPGDTAPFDDNGNTVNHCEECGQVMHHKTGQSAKGTWSGWFCETKGHPVKWDKN